MTTLTAEELGYGEEVADLGYDKPENDRPGRMISFPTRRGSTGMVPRRSNSTDSLSSNGSDNNDDDDGTIQMAAFTTAQAEERVYRRKPRRMSGMAALSAETIKKSMGAMPGRENSVYVQSIQQRIRGRRASMPGTPCA